MTDALVESKIAEAANAAAVAHEATASAREAQLLESEKRIAIAVGDQIKDSLAEAFHMPEDPDKPRKFIDVSRIQRICDDIARINKILMYILLGIGTLFLTLVGGLLLRGL